MGVSKCAQCLCLILGTPVMAQGSSVVLVPPPHGVASTPSLPTAPHVLGVTHAALGTERGGGAGGAPGPPPTPLFPPQGEGLHQLREALKILAERVLILETMIGLYGE